MPYYLLRTKHPGKQRQDRMVEAADDKAALKLMVATVRDGADGAELWTDGKWTATAYHRAGAVAINARAEGRE